MKRMRKNNTIILLVILLLSLSIGYALINTNLKINGTANVTKQTWDIHFENIQVTEGSVTTQNPATINPEYPTTVTYNIHLENPGDFYEFEVDAVNNGSIDAMITNITNTDNGQEISLPSYMEYKVTYSSGTDLDINHILEANTTETYKVGIYFKQDIQASDLANSNPLDLRLKFEVTYGQATEESTPTGDITVTFNPNGGTLSKTTKKVTTNGKYGNLPTPTRPGYKFKGWHGKNLFDPEVFYEIGKDYGVSIDENDIILSTFSYQQNYTQIPVNAKQNTQYTLSFDWEIITLISGPYITTGLRIWYYGDSSKARISGVVGDTGYIEITSDSGKTVRGISSYGWEYSGSVRLSNIQLEEGSTATPYEPYYITKDTTVVQTTNHTLTAIWEPITYNVTLDYNDGVTPSTTMQATYDSTYNNLPSPTRTGYTFKGWSILPDGYKQLDYIESTGTQYIDTNYIPKINTKFELDLSFHGDFKNYGTYGGNPAFLGSTDSNTQRFNMNFGSGANERNGIFPWFNKAYKYEGQVGESFSITDNIRTNRNTIKYESGRIQYGTRNRTISKKEVNQTSSMYIFGNNNSTGTGVNPAFTCYDMRVYEFKIYEDDTLMKHFIPCLNTTTNKEGLYDLVNNEFIGDATNQNFNQGSVIYIDSNTNVFRDVDHTLTAIWEENT